MVYAYFPETRRLALNIAGQITFYDTSDHQVSGVSQQQSGNASLTFTSQHGTVPVTQLRVVTMPSIKQDEPAQEPQQKVDSVLNEVTEAGHNEPEPQQQASTQNICATTNTNVSHNAEDDIFSSLEKLAALHKRGILSEQEFNAKKTELLARL